MLAIHCCTFEVSMAVGMYPAQAVSDIHCQHIVCLRLPRASFSGINSCL